MRPIDKLEDGIHCIIQEIDKKEVLSDDTIKKMETSLINFVINSTVKFIKGQKEHGGNLADRNLDEEITNETIDIYWYNEAKKWKEDTKEPH